MRRDHVRASKLLSYLLRHRPDSVGLTLSAGGWIDVDRLLEARYKLRASARGRQIEEVLLSFP